MTTFHYLVYPPEYYPGKGYYTFKELPNAINCALGLGSGADIVRHREDVTETYKQMWTDVEWRLDKGLWWLSFIVSHPRDVEYLVDIPNEEELDTIDRSTI